MTQAQQVLQHFKRKKTITDVEASGLYGIGQVAYVVWKLRKKGHVINSIQRQGMRARYVEYHYKSAPKG